VDDFLERHRRPLFVVLAAFILVGAFVFVLRQPFPEPIQIITIAPTAVPTPGPLRVYVSGAVQRPDVYTLPPGSIVREAVAAAGGPAPDADLDRINLAQPLSNGQQVHVPRLNEALSSGGVTPATPSTANGGLVNINTATVQELETLPGIGPVLAADIINYRNAHGPFQSIDEIQDVPDIGEARFERLRELITVGP
jgi:competence protein ComEA